MGFRFTPEAEQDLAEATDYLDQKTGNPKYSDELLKDIDYVTKLIAENPTIGRERRELRHGLRSISHGNYVVYWQVTGGTIDIVRVLHHSRDVEQAFGLR